MKAKDVNPYDLSSVAAAKRRLRSYVRGIFGGDWRPHGPCPEEPQHRPTFTHDDLVEYLEDIGLIGPGPVPLTPELIRLLPDRAQGAYQSAVTGYPRDVLTRWLCEQLAHALYEKHRYKIELAETVVKLFNLEELRQDIDKAQKLSKDLEEVMHRPGSKQEESNGM